MTADLRLVAHAAQADADIFASHRLRNRAGDRSFTGSRRSHQAKDRAGALLRQDADCQVFQHALFDLFQTIMVGFQNLFRMLQARVILRHFVPRQFQHRFQICPDHIRILAASRHILETVDLLADPLLYFHAGFDLLQLFLHLIRIRNRIFLSQLLSDHTQLLPQNIITLIFIQRRLYLRLKLAFHAVNL